MTMIFGLGAANPIDHQQVSGIDNSLVSDLSLSPDPQVSDLFTSTINSLMNNKGADNSLTIDAIKNFEATGSFSQNDLLSLEKNSGEFADNLSIVTKVVGLGTKFINEMTHLQ